MYCTAQLGNCHGVSKSKIKLYIPYTCLLINKYRYNCTQQVRLTILENFIKRMIHVQQL